MRHPSTAALAALLLLGAGSALAQPARVTPEVSDVATLPPPNSHRLWLQDMFTDASTQVIDADTGALKATIATSSLSSLAAGPGQRTIYVAESLWTHGNRGQRQDMITVYNGRTLKLEEEIPLPSRALVASGAALFTLNASGTRGYVYAMQPASSVVVVDLAAGKVLRTVDIPGCARAIPWGEDGFSSLCGDGSLATVVTSGAPSLTRTTPFFDAEHDPVFEESPADPATSRAWFVTYSGVVHAAVLGATPKLDAAWSLQEAAGLSRAGLANGDLAWRPGGSMPMALHAASGRMFVLMHTGEHWTHKKAGQELWVVDLGARRVLRRVPLEDPSRSIAVSQGEHPLVYVVNEKGDVAIRDGDDPRLKTLRLVEDAGHVMPIAPAM
ncbi:MAG TPA: amine dehydrogenase large subunit [Caulobacteraceae bacterium]|jgi:methylamine dehydrogenase heavy chain|nr:amine dehydrogenase large subunit [Caulobacteraceae bacterium]